MGRCFLIRIKNWPIFFWSGSIICRFFFDPDQKCCLCLIFFWSGSKIKNRRVFFYLDYECKTWLKTLFSFFLLFLFLMRSENKLQVTIVCFVFQYSIVKYFFFSRLLQMHLSNILQIFLSQVTTQNVKKRNSSITRVILDKKSILPQF